MVPAAVLNGVAADALLLDLDGTIADLRDLHQAAWKALFTGFFAEWHRQTGLTVPPLRFPADYFDSLDGRSRTDGVAAVLTSRGIRLPWGDPRDRPGTWSVCGLGNRKSAHLEGALRASAPVVWPDAGRLIDRAARDGLALALVSSSRHGEAILERVGLRDRFAVVISGPDDRPGGQRGKPAPDLYLHAADRLRVAPGRAVVVEDSTAGVRAGRAGRFGLVVGVDRGGRAEALRAHGADVVLTDLTDLPALIEEPVPC